MSASRGRGRCRAAAVREESWESWIGWIEITKVPSGLFSLLLLLLFTPAAIMQRSFIPSVLYHSILFYSILDGWISQGATVQQQHSVGGGGASFYRLPFQFLMGTHTHIVHPKTSRPCIFLPSIAPKAGRRRRHPCMSIYEMVVGVCRARVMAPAISFPFSRFLGTERPGVSPSIMRSKRTQSPKLASQIHHGM